MSVYRTIGPLVFKINGLLKFQHECNAKDSHILSTKNNSVFDYVVGINLMS